MFQLTTMMTRSSKSCSVLPLLLRFNNYSSSSSFPELKFTANQPSPDSGNSISSGKVFKGQRPINSMVAAVFDSLKGENSQIKTPQTDSKLVEATTVGELLTVTDGNGVSRRHALKVVSILADWSSTGKVKLSDFETDPRFLRLCRILSKQSSAVAKTSRNISHGEDLSTILNITAEDEAAKMVTGLTLSQMVKVMSALSSKKRRSILLLRSLAYNITGSSELLNLKEAGDLLYSMSTLNFPDENLLSRIAADTCSELENAGSELEKIARKSSVVGSILTSVGLLRYKNPALLDALSEWMIKNQGLCRPQDIFSLFLTLAVLNYLPTNAEKLFQLFLPQLTPSEAGKSSVWLEVVWSLVLLNKATDEHISSILDPMFLKQLEGYTAMSARLKLLNIEGAASYLQEGYTGPRLPLDSRIREAKYAPTKEKEEIVAAVLDTLRNLIQSEKLVRTRVDTGLGFFIDAECLLDKKCSPLPLEQIELNTDARRVAIMVYDYHDMCRGRAEPTGVNAFAANLLQAQGYRIVTIPYTEFKPRDKLIHRVQYLEAKLKDIVA
ncbi:unnamed protein product [Phaedon cochleariae]|uniref:RAP domain-containing protein n=1 Tax=Phaedon cochleariae TaxID=80249 RepID=A0A9P0DTM5_PHACE|nr:unnamed protein product [Phaedon cochleariae]